MTVLREKNSPIPQKHFSFKLSYMASRTFFLCLDDWPEHSLPILLHFFAFPCVRGRVLKK
uniref:Uncharacterized protein n=1 Tax=Meloidogyne enterolobii TaxID=390850 RepID=A0A6V7VEW8_MELEN|nr:unnamed protein product [Meloidogyne enterolobii]